MRRAFIHAVAAASIFAAAGADAAMAGQPARINGDGSMQIAGRRVECENVRMRLDRRLNNLGAASPDERLLLINPVLLGHEDNIVQLFVFHHECGHHHVGASELGADCWAVDKGVSDGWLDRKSLRAVCNSFGGAPETSTHPSAKRRCANLEQCFVKAEAKKQTPLPAATIASVQPVGSHVASPRLVSGPKLAWSGYLKQPSER